METSLHYERSKDGRNKERGGTLNLIKICWFFLGGMGIGSGRGLGWDWAWACDSVIRESVVS